MRKSKIRIIEKLTSKIKAILTKTESLSSFSYHVKHIAKKEKYSILDTKIYMEEDLNWEDFSVETEENSDETCDLEKGKTEEDQKEQQAIAAIRAICGVVEHRELDPMQLGVVGSTAHTQLVLAGAGSGKTLSIIGKVMYAQRTERYEAKDILVLVFARKNANEVRSRIYAETGTRVCVKTFHGWATSIIRNAEGKAPKFTKIILRNFIITELNTLPEFIRHQYEAAISTYYNRRLSATDQASIALIEKIIYKLKFFDIKRSGVPQYNANDVDAQTCNKIIGIAGKIYMNYLKQLEENQELDVDILLKKAQKYVEESRGEARYKMIIVDEYQDITVDSLELLKAYREKTNFDLCAVGDDWQSIFGFANVRPNVIWDFEKDWGKTEIQRLARTYRFRQIVLDICEKLLMCNAAQIAKNMKSMASEVPGSPIRRVHGSNIRYALRGLEECLVDLPRDAKIFFITRTTNIDFLTQSGIFNPKKTEGHGKTREKKMVEITYRKRPDLDIVALSAHKSKGLERDYVFLFDGFPHANKFPLTMKEEPILRMFERYSEKEHEDEERRLYYVALTRAKKIVFIVTMGDHIPPFSRWIFQNFPELFKKRRKVESYFCPECGEILSFAEDKFNPFYFCGKCYYSCKCDELELLNKDDCYFTV